MRGGTGAHRSIKHKHLDFMASALSSQLHGSRERASMENYYTRLSNGAPEFCSSEVHFSYPKAKWKFWAV